MQYYTLIYRYGGRHGNTRIHQFTHLKEPVRLDWMSDAGQLMRLGATGPWERTVESAMSWIRSFWFVSRWAVIIDPAGRVVLDWRRNRRDHKWRSHEDKATI